MDEDKVRKKKDAYNIWHAKKVKEDPEWYAKRKEASRLRHRKYREERPEYIKKRRFKEYAARVGETAEFIQSELDRLQGMCSCCNKKIKGKYYLDHDHNTGKFRGVVCCSCNIGLGHLDKEGWLQLALAYLERSK